MATAGSTSEILDLPVGYRDACAADLVLSLDLPRQDALAVRRFGVDGWHVELRILGASHQVLARHRDVLACSETLSCRDAGTSTRADLPVRHERSGPVADYAFASRIDRLDRDAFRSQVDDLAGPGDGAGLFARFPGDPWAVTGLQLDDGTEGELCWSGWHSYPKTGEVVTTSSRLVLRRRAGQAR